MPCIKNISIIILSLMLLLLTSCSSIKTNSKGEIKDFNEICIKNNPKVVLKRFDSYLQNGFNKYAINSIIEYDNNLKESQCSTILTYTARRTTTIFQHLYYANLILWQDEKQINNAEFNLPGGMANMAKFVPVQRRIDDLIKALLHK